MTPCPLSAPSLPPPGQVGGASALASALSQHHCPLISMMINLLLPGFLTKGLPRLTLLFDHTPALFFLLRLPSHHPPKSLETLTLFLVAQQWEGAGDARPEDKGETRSPEACASGFHYKCLNGSQQHPPIALCHTEFRKVCYGYFVFRESSQSLAESRLSCSQSKG